jgi:MFS transporter, ACS family, hexuronate transporter
VGIVASTIGYNPLFVCLMLFDVIGACVAWRLISNEQNDSAANPTLQPSHEVKA